MEPDTLAGYAALVTAAVGLVGASGTGIWKLIARADRRREKQEALLIPTLRRQIEAKDAELSKKERENRRLRHIIDIIHGDAEKWREQLIRNDIDPEPADWSAYPPEEGTL